MKKKPMMRADRLQRIQDLVDSNGSMTVGQLTQELDVSEATIRRDFDDLDFAGLLVRTHGGATSLGGRRRELPLNVRDTAMVAEKRAIARRASQLISPGDTIFIGGGSTTHWLAENLHDMQVTVVTNSLPVASELFRSSNVHVVVIGGSLRPLEMTTIGPRAVETIRAHRASIAFLGAPAIDAIHGFTVDGDAEAASDMAYIAGAQRTVLLADHTKLGQICTTHVVDLSEIDTVVTDDGADSKQIAALQKAGTNVLVVGVED
jgi:DeoR/GlpR family transcriptional regulator of sugar metabolism